jgi:hypothetical protein
MLLTSTMLVSSKLDIDCLYGVGNNWLVFDLDKVTLDVWTKFATSDIFDVVIGAVLNQLTTPCGGHQLCQREKVLIRQFPTEVLG